MTAPSDRAGDRPTREDRLAAKLRENLRRRKQQSRGLAGTPGRPLSKPEPDG